MASTFTLILDTIAPGGLAFSIEGGATYTGDAQALTNFTTTDPDPEFYQVKIWGDVDPALDASIQATEGASNWIAWEPTGIFVTLSAGDGSKTLSFRARDDVGNASGVLTDTIILDTTLPVPNINVAPDRTKISKVAGFNVSTFQFTVSDDIQAWKVKAVPGTGATEDQGTLIPVTGGSINTSGGNMAASTQKSVSITGLDLETASAGDGSKVIKVFIQDMSGTWSA